MEQIATGGMGTLWRAHHVELDVDVALKVISASSAPPDMIARFKREAQAAARLRSPNIVNVLDYGVHEGQPYLAMELLRGEDLAARLSRDKRLTLDATLTIIDGVARALQIAHDADIVHRDLKPANVFLENIGDETVVKVLDFGVAKDLGKKREAGVTTGGGVVGSPSYISPEQVWGEAIDRRTDVWAMGVVAFELLAGWCPFDDETLAKVFERIIRTPIPSVRERAPDLPETLDEFFAKAFARAPSDRFASAKDFAAALRKASSTDPSVVVVTPNPGRPLAATLAEPRSGSSAPRATKRSPRWLGAPVVLALVLGGLLWTKAMRPRTTSAGPPVMADPASVQSASNVIPPGTVLDPKPTTSSRAPTPSVEPTSASAQSAVASAPSARPILRSRPTTPRVDSSFGVPLDR